ncbi:MAG TPA: hypothetical protein VI336_00900 [Candidatus Saccharimonadales bacterium]|nr:hypothetical protein [Candidatus Saccharimonadales bacterium]
MKLLTSFVLTVTLALGLAIAWTFWGETAQVAAHEEKAKTADVTYSYVAQAGDSYTKMARKAVQTYGLKNKVSLSPASIIFAETNLTREAGSPQLNLGQKVEIKESTIHEWVDKAQNLSDAQEAAWNFYVQFVNFDTKNVGE